MENACTVIPVALIQGFVFWPLFKWSFLKIYRNNGNSLFVKLISASVFCSVVTGILLIAPVCALKILLNKNSLGSFHSYTFFLLTGIIIYKVFNYLSRRSENEKTAALSTDTNIDSK